MSCLAPCSRIRVDILESAVFVVVGLVVNFASTIRVAFVTLFNILHHIEGMFALRQMT